MRASWNRCMRMTIASAFLSILLYLLVGILSQHGMEPVTTRLDSHQSLMQVGRGESALARIFPPSAPELKVNIEVVQSRQPAQAADAACASGSGANEDGASDKAASGSSEAEEKRNEQVNKQEAAENPAPSLPPACNTTLQVRSFVQNYGQRLEAEFGDKQDILPFDRKPQEAQEETIWNDCSLNGCWRRQIIRQDSLSLPCMAEAFAEQETIPEDAPFFTHVINPFPNQGNDPQYNWTIRALVEAAEYAMQHNVSVEILAVHFQHEEMEFPEMVTPLSILCTWRQGHCVVRKRWGGLADDEVPVRAAVVGDVWTAGYSYGQGHYMIMTNYDIIVHRQFYTTLHRRLLLKRKLRVIDNLRLDLQVAAHGKISHWTVDDIFAWDKTHDHPGHDCFVVPRSWVKCMTFADFVFGIGNWGMTVIRELKYLTEMISAQTEVRSLGITRHLGHRTLEGDKWLGSGKDWKQSHAQQVKHNYWQFAKVVHRIKHERLRATQHIKNGRFMNFTQMADDKVISQVPMMRTAFDDEGLSCKDVVQRSFLADRSLLQHNLPPLLWTATPTMGLYVRRLLEYSSGYHIGSGYRDFTIQNEMPGERRCDESVLAIHVQPEFHSLKETLSYQFMGHCNKCQRLDTQTAFQNAIIVLEHPLEALWRLYELHVQRRTNSPEPGMTLDLFNEVDFAEASERLVRVLRQELRQFVRFAKLSTFEGSTKTYVVLRESDLNEEDKKVEAVEQVLRFLGLSADENRIRCAFALAEQPLRVHQIRRYLLATPDPNGNPPDWKTFSDIHQRLAKRVTAKEAFWDHNFSCDLMHVLKVELAYFNIPMTTLYGKMCN